VQVFGLNPQEPIWFAVRDDSAVASPALEESSLQILSGLVHSLVTMLADSRRTVANLDGQLSQALSRTSGTTASEVTRAAGPGTAAPTPVEAVLAAVRERVPASVRQRLRAARRSARRTARRVWSARR
jgi:hypothetical protein